MTQTEKRHRLFLEIWDEEEQIEDGQRFVVCFESGYRLYREYYRKNTCCYSHILPKRKFPQYDLVKKNIKIVHPNEHSKYEGNKDKAPKQAKLREELLAMHYLGNLKD